MTFKKAVFNLGMRATLGALSLLGRRNCRALESFWVKKLEHLEIVPSREEYILTLSANKNVVHIGFADYPFTEQRINSGDLFHLRLRKVANKTLGIDVSEEGVQKYIELTGDENVLSASIYDLEKYRNVLGEYDLFLMPEVIEHLDNPGLALRTLHSIMPENALLVITTPNALKMNNFLLALSNCEGIHPDHVALYTPYTLVNIAKRNGFNLINFTFYYSKTSNEVDDLFKLYPYLSPGLIGIFKKNIKHTYQT